MNATGCAATLLQAKETQPSVAVHSARLSFGDQVLFDDLDFVLPGGKWTCLLGPSGVGKTTLLRMIAGLVPTGGDTRIVCSDGGPLERRVAYMGQQDLLLPWLNLIDNVTLGFRLRRQRMTEARELGQELLNRVGLSKRARDLPATCSAGMRQRAALVRTLLEERPIVLMDEPFSALDAITRLKLQDLAAALLKDRTVLLVTHDPLEALRLGHRLVVMSGSPVRLDDVMPPAGPPPRNPQDPAVLEQQGKLLNSLATAQGTEW